MSELLMGTTNSSSSSGGSMFANASQHQEQQHQQLHHDYHHHPHHHHHQEQQQQQLQQSQQQLTQQLGSHLEQDGAAYSVPTIAEGEMDIVNVTREYPFEYAVVMFGYLLPVVLIVIIVTNLLVVAVLSQRHMRTPTNIVLLTMAIVDMATSLSPSPWYLYIYTFGNYEKFLYPPVACYAHHIMTDVVPIFFHVSSTWLALLLASQRYIYVCHPTLARTWCTVPRVKRAIMVILAVAFLHQLTRFFDNKFISVEIEVNHVKHMACKNEVADWVQAINDRTYVIIYFTIRIVFVFIIPCSALIILNWLLLRALKRAETKRTQLLRTKFKIVDVDPSQAGGERNSHQNLSVAAFGIVRDASSYFMGGSSGPGSGPPPRRPLGGVSGAGSSGGGASCLRIGQRGTLMGDRMMGNEEEEEEEEEDDEEDAEKNAPLTKGSLTLSSATPTRLINQTLVQRRPSEAGDLLTGDGQDIDNNNNISRHKKSMLDKTIGGGDDDDRGRLASANATAAAAPAVTTAAAATGSIVRGESLRSGSSASSNNDSVGPPGGSSNHSVSSTSKTDDISTCPECAAYEIEMRRGGCRRCSGSIEGQGLATSTTIASCEHHRSNCHRHLLHHQPISQCSSILGGVTNTTTNEEDISSCLVTQNISSSMFVPTTLDGIETSSMRGADDDDADDDDDGDNGHRDCDNNDHRVTHDDNDGELPLMADCDVAGETGPKDTREGDNQERLRRRQQLSRAGCGGGAPRLAQFRADSDLGQLIQSGSVDSRLACDCTTAKAVTLSRARSLGKQKQGRLSSCGVGSGCKIGGRSCSALDNSSSAQLSGGNQQQQQVMDSTTIGYRGPNHAAVTSNNSDLVSGTVTGGGQRACDMFVGGRTPAPATTTTNGAAGTEQLVAHLNKSASLMLRAAARADSDSSIMGQQSRSGCGVEQQIVDSTTELPVEGSGANRLSSQPPTANSTTNNNNGAASFQPATATTTLYSANTSSASSLLQVELQVGSGLCKQASPAQTGFGGGGAPAGSGGGGPNGRSPATTTTTTRRQSGGSSKPMMMTRSDHQLTAISGGNGQSHMAPQQHRTIKSPSFASCTTGRGSRATLLGTATSNNNNNNSGNGLPMIVSSGHRHHHNNHQHHHNSNNIQATIPASATRSMDSNRTTLMLVVVVTVFLIAEVPVGIVTATHVVVNLSDIFKDFEFDGFNEWVSYIRLFTNFLVMISYSVNFTIYCSMSKRFRETFRDLFWCGRQGRRKRSKRIFSQSQAPHCTQTTNPHQFAASTVMTSAANHNNNINGNHAHGHQNNNNNHYQGLVASNSNQTLLSHMPPRRPSERLGQQSECEL